MKCAVFVARKSMSEFCWRHPETPEQDDRHNAHWKPFEFKLETTDIVQGSN